MKPLDDETRLQQTVDYISIRPKGVLANDGFQVLFKKTPIELEATAPEGTAYVQMWFSAPCSSDAGNGQGYYNGGRLHKDMAEEVKLQDNLAKMHATGYVSPDETLKKLLFIPNHEGWGVVTQTSPNTNEATRPVAAFLPILSEDGTKILGVRHTIVDVDFQNIQQGDWVVTNAALRCDAHWAINSATGFPDKCDRSTEGGHTRKRVPGHFEMPGDSQYAPEGLPYPNHMLSKVPDGLRQWIENGDGDPEERIQALLFTEPLSCCFEAFAPILMGMDKGEVDAPKRIAILGDGPNAALLAFTVTTIFPDATIYMLGRSDDKLYAIDAISPEKIRAINTIGDSSKKGSELLRELLEKEGERLDVIVPTFPANNLTNYRDLLDPDNGRIVVWAADQVGNDNLYKEVIPDDTERKRRVHHSYGGWNQGEWTVLTVMDAVARVYPNRLEALCRYPTQIMGLQDAASAMENWLNNNGKHEVTMNDRLTSGKIVIDHRIGHGDIFTRERLPGTVPSIRE